MTLAISITIDVYPQTDPVTFNEWVDHMRGELRCRGLSGNALVNTWGDGGRCTLEAWDSSLE